MREGIQLEFKEVDPFVTEHGCYFLSTVRIVELFTGKDFSLEEVQELYKEATRLHMFRYPSDWRKMVLNYPQEFINHFVGREVVKNIHKSRSIPTLKPYYLIQRRFDRGHIMVMQQDGKTWDPWPLHETMKPHIRTKYYYEIEPIPEYRELFA